MFGLTFEKLFLVALLAAVVIGPQRLPSYAEKLTDTIRSFREFMDATRARAAAEIGMEPGDWEALDPRHYDPRRIVRHALEEPATDEPSRRDHHSTAPDVATASTVQFPPEIHAEAARVRPGQQFLVSGSAAHPRRVALTSLPAEDPRRLATRRPSVSDQHG